MHYNLKYQTLINKNADFSALFQYKNADFSALSQYKMQIFWHFGNT